MFNNSELGSVFELSIEDKDDNNEILDDPFSFSNKALFDVNNSPSIDKEDPTKSNSKYDNNQAKNIMAC